MRRAGWLILVVAAAGCGADLGGSGSFDLAVSGAGFGADEGKTMWIAVVRTDTGTIVASDSATVQNGTFAFLFSALLDQGVAYEVDYYADVNGDGRCEPPPADQPWRRDVPPPTASVSLDLTFDTSYDAQACSVF